MYVSTNTYYNLENSIRLVNKAKYTIPGLYQEKEHVLRFLIYGGS